jgi:hypothetical protein
MMKHVTSSDCDRASSIALRVVTSLGSDPRTDPVACAAALAIALGAVVGTANVSLSDVLDLLFSSLDEQLLAKGN